MGYTDFQIVVKDNIRLRIFDQTADIYCYYEGSRKHLSKKVLVSHTHIHGPHMHMQRYMRMQIIRY
jgi:hypothetical protein